MNIFFANITLNENLISRFGDPSERYLFTIQQLMDFPDVFLLPNAFKRHILEEIPQKLLKYQFDTKKEVLTISLEITYLNKRTGFGTTVLFGHEINIQRVDGIDQKVVLAFVESSTVSRMRTSLGALLNQLGFLYNLTNKLTDKDKEIINEFRPGILDCLSQLLRDLFHSIQVSLLRNKKQITIDFTKFQTSEELGEWLFKEIIGYEKLQPKLEELKQILKELEELRKDLLKVSYS